MSKKRGFTVPVPVSILLMPVLLPTMFIVAGLSIPYTSIMRRVQRRREERLEANLSVSGRVIGWDDFLKAMNDGRGTLIEERFSFKRNRWWWTPENVYEKSPYPTVDWMTMQSDDTFRPFAYWCRERYTDPEKGHALFVSFKECRKGEGSNFWRRVRDESSTSRWIEVVPPESLPKE